MAELRTIVAQRIQVLERGGGRMGAIWAAEDMSMHSPEVKAYWKDKHQRNPITVKAFLDKLTLDLHHVWSDARGHGFR